ncbi:MAG: HNH endonuclease [Clostridia bacterium]|nr:HNH endonuclease [Clostridia bacterium]
MDEKLNTLKKACELLLYDSKIEAVELIRQQYQFEYKTVNKRKYSGQKMKIFIRDGFIDRYSGKKLVIPGILKVLSTYFPKDFPYQSHWKMSETHSAYWEFIPTIDHVSPIATGGRDDEANWVTTSMINNSIKSNWTLEQLGWVLYEPGDFRNWDGLTNLFICLVDKDRELLKDPYVKNWYSLARRAMENKDI